jgi:hypothetical protein
LKKAAGVDEAVRYRPEDRRVEELRLRLGEELGHIGALARRDRRLEFRVVLGVRYQRELHGDVRVRGLEGLDHLVEHVGVALGGPDVDGAGGRFVVDRLGGGLRGGVAVSPRPQPARARVPSRAVPADSLRTPRREGLDTRGSCLMGR